MILVLLILYVLGISPSAYLNASLVALALTFVFQSIIQGFACGMFIAVEGLYDVGDFINCAGVEGTVLRRGIRTTILQCEEQVVIIPSALLFSVPVTVGKPK